MGAVNGLNVTIPLRPDSPANFCHCPSLSVLGSRLLGSTLTHLGRCVMHTVHNVTKAVLF